MTLSEDEWEYSGSIVEVPKDGLFEKTFRANDKLECWEEYDKLEYPWFLNAVINRLNEGFAPIIVVCGPERIGKSTMAVDIAYRLCNEANALDLDLDHDSIKEHLAYEPETFLEIITENSEGRKPVLVDEAGVVAGSQDFQTTQNKIIKKTIQTMGYLQNVYIFILPDFMALDKKVRNKVDFKVELYDRGKAKVTGIKTNFGKMRSNEYNFYKQPLPSFWSARKEWDNENDNFKDEHKAKTMKGYDEKEKAFKMGNAEEMLDELEQKKKEQEEDEVIDLNDMDIDLNSD